MTTQELAELLKAWHDRAGVTWRTISESAHVGKNTITRWHRGEGPALAAAAAYLTALEALGREITVRASRPGESPLDVWGLATHLEEALDDAGLEDYAELARLAGIDPLEVRRWQTWRGGIQHAATYARALAVCGAHLGIRAAREREEKAV